MRKDSIQNQTKIITNPFDDCCVLIEGRLLYDFPKCISFLEWKGREIFGGKFKIYHEDHDLLYRLLLYIIGDRDGASAHGLSLQKGLFLTGPVGCGKTSLMMLLRFFQPPSQRYVVRSCRDISLAFIKDGYDIIHAFNLGAGLTTPRVFCFDDLGIESNLKYYGNECNVMAEILLSRYDLFVSHGLLTHVTSNCNSSEIERFYGNRVRSRMREMFNLVAFPKDTKDRRS